MSNPFSAVIAARPQGDPRAFSMWAVDLSEIADRTSPVLVLDDFRVRKHTFPAHPHAGFCAVTYVFEDSEGSLRARDSLGNDVTMAPGGIVWTQTGSGMMHEERPAEDGRELHGLQLFVNLSSKHKSEPPRIHRLEAGDVPVWSNEKGDRVRVLVGSFDGVTSPLVPSEPFRFFDITLHSEVSIDLPANSNGVVYVLRGNVQAIAREYKKTVAEHQAVAVQDARGSVAFRSSEPSHLVFLSGVEIQEPVVAHGPFIMNDSTQIAAAIRRYASGQMGHLETF